MLSCFQVYISKYTHTHTHTHTQIYIYLLTHNWNSPLGLSLTSFTSPTQKGTQIVHSFWGLISILPGGTLVNNLVNVALNYGCISRLKENVRAIFKYLKNCGVGVSDLVASEGSERAGSASYSVEHRFKIRKPHESVSPYFLLPSRTPMILSAKQ